MVTNVTNLRLNWLIATALIGWLMWLLAPVLTPFVASALLAYVGDPLADRLQRLKLPRTIAVVTVFLLTFGGIALLVRPNRALTPSLSPGAVRQPGRSVATRASIRAIPSS